MTAARKLTPRRSPPRRAPSWCAHSCPPWQGAGHLVEFDQAYSSELLAERTVTNLLDRYDELRALATADPRRLEPLLRPQGRVILAIDGLQPDVGHEVLWIFRDCLSGEILLAQSLLSSTAPDLAGLIDQVRRALPVPITGMVSDGQESIRKAVAKALDGVPHQLCHFHYLREAAKPISEADRHAKKELKKRVRGIRPIERRAEKEAAEEGKDDAAAEVVRGYCAAVRAALTDDGLPPLAAAGLKLHDRLSRIAASLDHVASLAGGLPGGLSRLRQLLRRGLEETAALWPAVREAYKWVKRVARILKNEEGLPAKKVRRRLVPLLGRMRRAATTTGEPSVRAGLKQFLKVTRSYCRACFGATTRRTCRGRTTTWSTPSAAIATTSVGPVVGVGPRRVWS